MYGRRQSAYMILSYPDTVHVVQFSVGMLHNPPMSEKRPLAKIRIRSQHSSRPAAMQFELKMSD